MMMTTHRVRSREKRWISQSVLHVRQREDVGTYIVLKCMQPSVYGVAEVLGADTKLGLTMVM